MTEAALPPRLRQLCHDLSQPLTVARCTLELALGLPADDPERADLLSDAMSALDRLAALAAEIRDFSQSG